MILDFLAYIRELQKRDDELARRLERIYAGIKYEKAALAKHGPNPQNQTAPDAGESTL